MTILDIEHNTTCQAKPYPSKIESLAGGTVLTEGGNKQPMVCGGFVQGRSGRFDQRDNKCRQFNHQGGWKEVLTIKSEEYGGLIGMSAVAINSVWLFLSGGYGMNTRTTGMY